MPAGAYGDNMGGMTIAGGISAALFARERTGEPSIVDVSLLSVGAWATSLSVNTALLTGSVMPVAPLDAPPNAPVNPLIGNFRTSDGRWINLTMLQAGRYWADVCRNLGLEQYIEDERFDDGQKLIVNAIAAGEIIAGAIATHTYAELLERFKSLEGQWAPNQDSLELAAAPQVRANGYIDIATLQDEAGVERELVTNPVQFEETPATLTRAPQFAEHTDDILRELGKSDEELIELKIEGAVT
jgi:crotonobetainyl-CoA:carnitine CoA-transferase CaiB-like acyl-CoA transferase